MSTYGAYKRIDDGLVLHLDAANIKSFRGEPTVNYDQLTNSNYYGCNNNYASYCIITSGYFHGKYCYKIDFNLPNGTVFDGWRGAYFNLTNSDLYSLGFANNDYVSRSFDVYIESINNSSSYYPQLSIEGDSINKSFTYIDKTIIGKWQRISETSQLVDINTTNNFLFYVSLNSAGTTTSDLRFVIYLSNAQLEKKDHATSYTSTSRGTTVATGGGFADLSGYDNHGELVNGVLYDSNNCGSLVFDGVNDYVNIPYNSVMNSFPLTITGWCKFTQGGDFEFINKYGASSVNGYSIRVSVDGVRTYFFRDGSNFISNYNGYFGGPLEYIKWYHIVVVFNHNGRNIYINGVYKDSQNWTGIAGQVTSTTNIRIGVYPNYDDTLVNYFSGISSEYKFYNRALSQSEITQLYNSTKTRYI